MSQAAEVPKPPDDPELRNIIDKLAQFVAKNGPDFENMTKQKQKDNPRFGFLYGGEYFHYYMYRVTIEQALARKRQQVEQQQQQSVQQTKLQVLQAQIQESERNLKAQYDVLMKQQENEINDAIRAALEQQIYQVAEELRLNISDLAAILDGMAYPYAQEGQEAAVSWICSHYVSPKHGELLVRYLLERIKDPREYLQRKLSILYVISSLMQQHMPEQNREHMVALMNRFAPIMSSYAMKLHGLQDERARNEVDQLIRSWMQHRLFDGTAEWRCANIDETIAQYQNELKREYADIVADVSQRIQNQYRQYEMQHHEYARHIQQQITAEQYQQQQATAMTAPQLQQQPSDVSGQMMGQQPTPTQPTQPRRSRFDDAGPVAAKMAGHPPPPPSVVNPVAQAVPPGVSPWQQPPPLIAASAARPPALNSGPPPGMYNQPPPNVPPPMMGFPPPASHQQQPPFQRGWPPGNVQVPPSQPPWISGPPPGMAPGQQPQIPFGPALPPPGVVNVNVSQPPPKPMMPIDEQSLIPKVAYYDLPAGLMAPLIKMEDHKYEPLKPGDLRLPPPMPPSERLVAALEAFYSPPSHEHPRDSDGWERLGLYEYYKEKAKAIQKASSKKKDSSKADPSDRDTESREKRQGERRHDDDDSDDDRNRRRSESGRRSTRSASNSPSRSGYDRGRRRNRSPSPDEKRRGSRRSQSGDSRSRDDSRSSRSKSADSSNSGSRSPRRSSRHKKSRSRDKKDRDRKGPQRSRDADDPRGSYSDDDNERGHHGFGSSPQEPTPIRVPQSSQAVDPFENFRRAQSAGFNQRLKAAFQTQPR